MTSRFVLLPAEPESVHPCLEFASASEVNTTSVVRALEYEVRNRTEDAKYRPYDDDLTIDTVATDGVSWVVALLEMVGEKDHRGILGASVQIDCFERAIQATPEVELHERDVDYDSLREVLHSVRYQVRSQHGESLDALLRRAGEIKTTLRETTGRIAELLANEYIAAREKVFRVDSLTLPDRYARVEDATGSTMKGKALEDLVLRLAMETPGFDPQPGVRTRTEELDIEILNRSPDLFWQKQSPIIIVECKNWTTKCGKNEYVSLLDKVRNRRNKCELGVLVSWNGFARTVEAHSIRGSTEPEVIVLLDRDHLREAIAIGLAEVIVQQWRIATRS